MSVEEILPGVRHWTAVHPALGMEVSSYWLVPEGVVLDPMLPPQGGVEAFAEDPPRYVVLIVGGVMNVLWIAGIAILVLLEKVVPTGRLIPRLSGAGMIAAGLLLLFGIV